MEMGDVVDGLMCGIVGKHHPCKTLRVRGSNENHAIRTRDRMRLAAGAEKENKED